MDSYAIRELIAAAKRAQPTLNHAQALARAVCALLVLGGDLTDCEINETIRRLSQPPTA